ncbi:hypothetical protein [Nocardioides yefusunii]|uniref:Alpha-tubulin suppressor-like RCC1 family protein n=1 Tax=Nocardioides yefusunii TaxID=2500546 RepID=A0ABW1QXF2_9ACTN|nr:hypothetical protein [Nocardioides yefusunii]
MHSPEHTSLSRRAVVRTLSWTTPAVAVAAAAPAYATSVPSTGQVVVENYAIEPVDNVPTPTVEQCQQHAGITFLATRNNQPAPTTDTVTVQLPFGLTFAGGLGANVDGVTVLEVPVGRNGVVTVPAIVPTGSAGTYTVTVAYRGETTTQSVVVTPAPGEVFEIHRSTGSSTASATFSALEVSVGSAVSAGAIMGDQYTATNSAGSDQVKNGANGAVIAAGGTVRLWGRNIDAPTTAPVALKHSGTEVTGMQFVDAWTSIADNDQSTGGVAASASGNVFQWYRTGTTSGTLVVAKVSGITGTVLQVASDQTRSYVRTTTGVFSWTTATRGSSATATQILASGNVTQLDTFGYVYNGTKVGGSAIADGKLWSWGSDAKASSIALPAGATGVAKIATGSAGLMILDTAGNLWSRGVYSSDANSWTKRASDVVDFSFWGFGDIYAGGMWITTAGTAFKFFGDRTWYTPEPVTRASDRTPLSGITKTFSSDGTYLLLTSDGTVWATGGNLDNAGRNRATTLAVGSGTTTDLNVWGLHLGSNYYGGGYVLKNSAGC